MATIKYFLKGKGESVSIYVRVREGRTIDLTKSTGFKIKSEYWNNKNGKPKQTASNKNGKPKQTASNKNGKPKQIASNKEKLNLIGNLNEMETFLYSAINEEINTSVFNSAWLAKKIELFHNPSLGTEALTLINVLELYKEELKTKINPKTQRPISRITIKGYNTTISRLKRYFELNPMIELKKVDLSFHSDYSKFASNKMNLSINSIGTDLRKIKTSCLDLRDKGHEINRQVESRKFNAPSEKTLFTTLNELELKAIHKVDLKQNYLQNARDWLLIGCWTGCRVSDLMKLTNDNVMITAKGQKFIRYTQSKTDKQVDIPMHPVVEEITNRLKGFPRAITDVNLNKYIKEVCELAKINELIEGTRQNPKTHRKETGLFPKYQLIRSHTMRRSFATNHYNKLSNKIIMRVTGHSTETMLLNYIGETETDHLDDFMNVWSNDKQEENKAIKKEA